MNPLEIPMYPLSSWLEKLPPNPKPFQVTTKLDNPNFYEMSAVLAAGPTGLQLRELTRV